VSFAISFFPPFIRFFFFFFILLHYIFPFMLSTSIANQTKQMPSVLHVAFQNRLLVVNSSKGIERHCIKREVMKLRIQWQIDRGSDRGGNPFWGCHGISWNIPDKPRNALIIMKWRPISKLGVASRVQVTRTVIGLTCPVCVSRTEMWKFLWKKETTVDECECDFTAQS
jgi:hypothetical protein